MGRSSGAVDGRRGYGKLFLEDVLQAPQGCDFDFLRLVR